MAKKSSSQKRKNHQQNVSILNKAEKLFSQGHFPEALPLYVSLLEQHPNHPDLLYRLGYVHYACTQYTQAATVLQTLINIRPEHEDGRRMLLASFIDGHMTDEMLILADKIKNNPLTQSEYLQVFSASMSVCDWNAALPMLDTCIEDILNNKVTAALLPGFLTEILGISEMSCETMFKLVKKAGELNSQNIQQLPERQSHKTSGRKIRIAYLSADFKAHPVGYFIYPILAAHNRDQFEVYCYSGTPNQDTISNLIRKACQHFIDVSSLNEEEIAKTIHNDGIDILIELGGYTENSKLKALPYRPAPVSIEYLGYANSTGNPYVDFRITDSYADTIDGTRYTETLLTMPNSFLCFGMRPDCTRTEQAPANKNNYITFGSFNHIRKLNPTVIKAWSSILNQTPNARLALKAKWHQGHINNNILKAFNDHGIDSKRIIFLPHTKTYDDHVACYNDIDIALDTFPYSGTTTTCEALWMGVPVVTLVGKAHQNRVSYSILKNIGFEETICHTIDAYIEKAVDLASRPQNLTFLRPCIHTLFTNSAICNPHTVTSQIEEQYLKAWEIKMGSPALAQTSMKHELTVLTMNKNITIMLPQDLNQISTYVVTEQGDWYEDELRFLRLIAKPGMRTLDCSAEYGCYSLSLAKEVGNEGAVLAIAHDVNKRNAIEESAKLNHFDWLSTGTDASSFLENCVDILIHPLESDDATTSYLDINANHSPLIMIHAMQEDGINQAIAKRMQEQGYDPYRLIPSLHLLIPLQDGFTPTSWHRQVFFCKEDKAEELASNDFLMLHELESIDLPDDLSYWQKTFEGRVFANALLPLWIEQIQEGQVSDEWEHVRNALAAYAMANNKNSSAQQRYAYLSAALNILLNTEQLQSSVARLCTVARIASELGNYTTAIQAAQMAHEGITTLQTFTPDEPFLSMDSTYDQIDFQNNLAEWVLAQALAQTELLKKPTSFGIDNSKLLNTTDTLQEIGFINDNLCHRELLVRQQMHFNDKGKARTHNTVEDSTSSNLSKNQQTQKKEYQDLMIFDHLSPNMWRMLRSYYAKARAEKNQSLLLAIPNGKNRDKIASYLQNMHQIDAITGLNVQMTISGSDEESQLFLHKALQQSSFLHTPKTRSTKLQNISIKTAKEMDIEIVWHDEKPTYIPAPLPPVENFRVSIILLTYNRVELLKRAVESVLKQTYMNLTLIISDDVSSDGTEEYCRHIAQENIRVIYRRNEQNCGVSENFRNALNSVSTELLVNLADDDYLLDATALERMVEQFRSNPRLGMAFGQCHIGDIHTGIASTVIPANITQTCTLDPQQLMLDSINGNNIFGGGLVIRQAALARMAEYGTKHWRSMSECDVLISEGDYLSNLLAVMCVQVAYVHIPAVFYSIGKDTFTSSQLGGGWSIEIRLRTVALLDDMYKRQYGKSQHEDNRIQQIAEVFEQQLSSIKNGLSSKEKILHQNKLEDFTSMITSIKKHMLPEIIASSTLV